MLSADLPNFLRPQFAHCKSVLAAMASANTRYNFLVIFFVALGSFTYGFNSAISGSVLGLSSFLNYFQLSTTGPNATKGNHLIGGELLTAMFNLNVPSENNLLTSCV